MNTSLKGKLDKIVPKVNLSIDNVNVKNVPSNTTVTMLSSKVDLTADGEKINGLVNLNNAQVLNPMAKITAPSAKITFGEKDINIDNAYILLNNSRIDITGRINDYTNKNLKFNICGLWLVQKANYRYLLMWLETIKHKISHSI